MKRFSLIFGCLSVLAHAIAWAHTDGASHAPTVHAPELRNGY